MGLTSNFATDFGDKTRICCLPAHLGPDDDFLSIDDPTHDLRCISRRDLRSRKEHLMPIGTVKFFNTDKGYGFIAPEDGGADSFVHISAVQAAGMQTLNKDQRLSYEVERGRNGKESAINLEQA
jgi:CspA family cold shock protein